MEACKGALREIVAMMSSRDFGGAAEVSISLSFFAFSGEVPRRFFAI
jgi:hypothetical protein